MTLDQIGDLLHTAPGIVEGFAWHMTGSDCYDSPIKKQGGDGREKSWRKVREFRVRLNAGGSRFADVTKPTIGEALREAFEKVGVPMPGQLAARFGKVTTKDKTEGTAASAAGEAGSNAARPAPGGPGDTAAVAA